MCVIGVNKYKMDKIEENLPNSMFFIIWTPPHSDLMSSIIDSHDFITGIFFGILIIMNNNKKCI